MKIVDIFVVTEECLYSFLFENETLHEFRRIFENWSDAAYLEEFFTKHEEDLRSGFWERMSIENAVLKTKREAELLEEKLIEVAESGRQDRYATLSSLFKPLHDKTTKIEEFEFNKVKGDSRKSWLRIYAVRIDSNLFVITGGGIKLTATMNEKEHLLQELEKLEVARKYLLNEENYDSHEIFELFL